MPVMPSSLDRFGAGAGESPELSTNMSLWLSNSFTRFLMMVSWLFLPL